MRAFCPGCDFPADYNPKALGLSAIGIICGNCGQSFKPPKEKRTGRSDNQIRSRDQERKAAKRYGGQRQPGSGASKRAKGDFRDTDRLRGECKFTRAASFSLKLEELMKIEKEATARETPIFEVQFQGVFPNKTYVVLSADRYQTLLDELEELRQTKT